MIGFCSYCNAEHTGPCTGKPDVAPVAPSKQTRRSIKRGTAQHRGIFTKRELITEQSKEQARIARLRDEADHQQYFVTNGPWAFILPAFTGDRHGQC